MRSCSFVFKLISTACFTFFLLGCTNLWQAGWQTVHQSRSADRQSQALGINPNLRYLKVAINQHEVFMVEAYRLGSESVWVSSDQAIIKTRNGYLSDLEGFRSNWQEVRGPDLGLVAQLTRPTAYTRVRNEMPGYRYQVRESVLITPLAAAPKDILFEPSAGPSLRWFSEEVRSQAGGLSPPYHYPGLFAIDISQKPIQVVFGQQCLASDYCIRWQRVERTEGLSRAKP